MNFSIVFEGGTAGVFLAAGTLAVLAWNCAMARRENQHQARVRVLCLLRVAALLLLAFIALEPVVQRLHTSLLKPRLAILLDAGLSMGASDGTPKTRLQRAAQWLSDHRAEISARAEPVLYAGSDRIRRISWERLPAVVPSATGFDFHAAVQDVSEDGGASRLWLLSDGNSEGNPGEDVSAYWKAPVDALGIGPRRASRAVVLADLRAPDFVFLHLRFPVTVNLEASNLEGGIVLARLWKGPSLVSEVKVPVQRDYEVVSATFTAVAEALGRERYRMELTGFPAGSAPGDERAVSKASREFGVEVIRQKHRIMYLSGRPSPEYAHLRDLLKANPNFEVVSFVILRHPDNVSPVPDSELSLIPFPAHEIFAKDLMQFDVFILENFSYRRFNLSTSYLEGLKRFVAQGGALLVIGGSNAFTQGGYRGTPLEEILPVTLWNSNDDYVPGLFAPKILAPQHPLLVPSDAPEASEDLWALLPPLDGFNRFSSIRPGAAVLLAHPKEKTQSGDPMPVLAIRESGKGKVMVLGTDSTWRWKLGGGAEQRVSSFYARFWSRAVQYLSGTLDLKKVKFSPLPDRMPAREPACASLRLFDESFHPLPGAKAELKVVWTSPDGISRAVTPRETGPGVFDIELTGLKEGAHSLRAAARYRGISWGRAQGVTPLARSQADMPAWGEDQVRFVWESKPPEVPLQRQWLSRVTDRSGGRYADIERATVSEWLDLLPAARSKEEVLHRWHAWTWEGWLFVLMGLFLIEWFLRRKWGFV